MHTAVWAVYLCVYVTRDILVHAHVCVQFDGMLPRTKQRHDRAL